MTTAFGNDNGGDRRSTRVVNPNESKPASAANPGGGRVTKVFQEDNSRRPPSEPPQAGRPITGVMFTYTWSRAGQLFQVYAGRNYAGTAGTTREGEATGILLGEDSTMSGTHFLVLYQAGKYRISDCNSTNGTFVNGEQITPQGLELDDNAHIVAGNTLFVFKKIQPPAAGTERKPKDYEPVQVKDQQPEAI